MLLEIGTERVDFRRSEGTLRLAHESCQFALDVGNFIVERQSLGKFPSRQLRGSDEYIGCGAGIVER